MHATYGAFPFDSDSFTWEHTCPAKLDNSGVPYSYSPQYKLRCMISVPDTGNLEADQAALTVKLAEFEAAFAKQFQNFIIYDNAGNETVHKLINSQTIGGVKVLARPEYPTSALAEYSTFRHATVTIGAEVSAVPGQAGNPITEWEEIVSYRGTGGRRRIWQEYIYDPPDQQDVAQFTTIRCVQRGSAMGLTAFPTPPPPLFPLDLEHEPERGITLGNPQTINGQQKYFPVSWEYYFEFASAQFRNPTPRPT
jgi:hypothetical protein